MSCNCCYNENPCCKITGNQVGQFEYFWGKTPSLCDRIDTFDNVADRLYDKIRTRLCAAPSGNLPTRILGADASACPIWFTPNAVVAAGAPIHGFPVSPDNGGGSINVNTAAGTIFGNIQNGLLIDTGDAPPCAVPNAIRGADGRAYDSNALSSRSFLLTIDSSRTIIPSLILTGPIPAGTANVRQSGSFTITNTSPCYFMSVVIDAGIQSGVFLLDPTPTGQNDNASVIVEISKDGGATWEGLIANTVNHRSSGPSTSINAHRLNYWPDTGTDTLAPGQTKTILWREVLYVFVGNAQLYLGYQPTFRVFGFTNG